MGMFSPLKRKISQYNLSKFRLYVLPFISLNFNSPFASFSIMEVLVESKYALIISIDKLALSLLVCILSPPSIFVIFLISLLVGLIIMAQGFEIISDGLPPIVVPFTLAFWAFTN